MSAREYPKVYCHFEGKKVVNGVRRKYWIQDATKDMYPEIMYQLENNFIGDEPTTKYLNCKADAVSMKEFNAMWQKMLDENYSLACFTKDELNNVKLAGFNVLTESKADAKEEFNVQGSTINTLFKIIDYCEHQRDFHKEFNLKTCMKAMGLYVLQDYRGEGLGERILDARELLCKNVGISASVTAFTSFISQKVAAKVGFQDFYAIDYAALGEVDADMKIPNIEEHTKNIKFMYKLYK